MHSENEILGSKSVLNCQLRVPQLQSTWDKWYSLQLPGRRKYLFPSTSTRRIHMGSLNTWVQELLLVPHSEFKQSKMWEQNLVKSLLNWQSCTKFMWIVLPQKEPTLNTFQIKGILCQLQQSLGQAVFTCYLYVPSNNWCCKAECWDNQSFLLLLAPYISLHIVLPLFYYQLSTIFSCKKKKQQNKLYPT